MKGYNSLFIDSEIRISLPEINENLLGHTLRSETLRDSIYLDYLHYTLVMNKTTKQLIYAASNLNQKQLKQSSRNRWNTDSRVPTDSQLHNIYYKNNDWDRGHMVRRATNSWGQSPKEAQKGSNATMFYTNASFQHANFNQDEWLGLENMFKNFKEDENDKINIFTGPIHMEYDRHYHRTWHDSVRIPSGFFKIICFKNKEQKLETRAFVLFQDDEALVDKNGLRRGFKFKNHQVTVAEIESMTGLEFDEIMYDTNPLLFHENEHAKDKLKIDRFPERILVDTEEDIINTQNSKRKHRILEEEKQVVKIISAMVNPSGNERENEWISIFNLSAKSIKLDNWYLKDRLNRKINLDGNSIDPGSSLRINIKEHKNAIRLSNKGNSLTLYDAEDNIMDSKAYSKINPKLEDLAILL